jgi:hypothetical protein
MMTSSLSQTCKTKVNFRLERGESKKKFLRRRGTQQQVPPQEMMMTKKEENTLLGVWTWTTSCRWVWEPFGSLSQVATLHLWGVKEDCTKVVLQTEKAMQL